MVCFRAYGQEIQFGPDVASAGFGAAPLPAGASMTPPASIVPLPQVAPIAPAPAPVAMPVAPVTPNPSFAQMPVAPLVRQMTPAANGVAYEAYIANGWTDAQLIANGLMLP
jgi:hypothetical protein